MADFVNIVRLQGTVERLHVGNGKRGKYAFADLKVSDKGKIAVVVWDAGVAADLEDCGRGALVQASGALETRKDAKFKDEGGREAWVIQVVITKVTLVATPDEAMAEAPPAF